MLFNFCIFFVNVLVISVRWNETNSSSDVSQSPINMKESERAVKGSTGTRSDAKEKRETEGGPFFSLFLLPLLLSSPFTLLAWKKKMTIQVSEYTVLPMLVSKKKPAITSLRPHSKMVNNPFFLIKSNPVNTVPNGPKKFGGINGWPY